MTDRVLLRDAAKPGSGSTKGMEAKK